LRLDWRNYQIASMIGVVNGKTEVGHSLNQNWPLGAKVGQYPSGGLQQNQTLDF